MRRQKIVGFTVAFMAIAALAGALLAARHRIREEWYLWRLETADRKVRAALLEALAKMGSVRIVPPLLQDLAAKAPLEDSQASDASDTRKHREFAMLLGLGPRAVPALLEHLRSDRPDHERAWTLRTLPALDSTASDVLSALHAHQSDRNPTVGLIARSELLRIQLVRALKSSDLDKRVAAAMNLKYCGPLRSTSVPFLIEALASADGMIRMRVAEVLGLMRSDAGPAVGGLAALGRDPEERVQEAAARALSLIEGR